MTGSKLLSFAEAPFSLGKMGNKQFLWVCQEKSEIRVRVFLVEVFCGRATLFLVKLAALEKSCPGTEM